MSNISRRDFIKGALAGTASLAALGISGVSALADDAIYTPGTYSATAQGMSIVTVTMTFDEKSITDVVLDVSGETPSIGAAPEAQEALKAAILAAQGGEIDGYSGATITSTAVKKAAEKCIKQAKGEIPVEVIEKAEKAADGDWLGKAPEIDEAKITKTFETEILVIGCGTGGMFTIASAAEEGAKVIGIDRFEGKGVGLRDDLGAIDSRYQKEWGTKIDKFEYITMATQYASGRIKQELVKKWADNSGAVIDWYGDRLAERGVELWHEAGEPEGEDGSRYKHFATGHSPRWAGSDDGNGNVLDGNKVLYDYALEKGAEFHYGTKMIKLDQDADGVVTGCIAVDNDGNYIRYIATKGTVVCTGGYSLNIDMMEALQPETVNIIGGNFSEPGAWGDGIKACLWAGAKMDETQASMLFDRSALFNDEYPGRESFISRAESGFFWIGSQPWLKVNKDGKRFFNESGTYDGILHADEYNRDHCHYTLFDANWTNYCQQFKMHGCSRLVPFSNGADPNIPWQAIAGGMLPGLVADGYVQQADTIEELAEKLNIPAEELKATVDHYNEMAYAGEDTDFGKEDFRLTPVDTAPFYGARNAGSILCTLNGIVIDVDNHALDADGFVIPGLYVNGNDSGCYFANSYPNLSTGMACGRTVTFGYLLGKQLAK